MDSMVPSMSNGPVVSVVCCKPPGFLLSKENCEAGRTSCSFDLVRWPAKLRTSCKRNDTSNGRRNSAKSTANSTANSAGCFQTRHRTTWWTDRRQETWCSTSLANVIVLRPAKKYEEMVGNGWKPDWKSARPLHLKTFGRAAPCTH